MKIKICGLRTVADAEACVAAGVDLAGLNFVPGRRRAIDIGTARAISAALAQVIPVGVFLDAEPSVVVETAVAVGLRYIQLHGAEPPEVCARLRGPFVIIKALTAATLEQAPAYAPFVAAFLVDGREPGTGAAWDYSRSTGPRLCGRPLLLAGGLTPERVESAIVAATPAGVDVASGVERDGAIDPARVAAFALAARRAAARISHADPLTERHVR